ncbi:hypothetical protein D3C71_2121310 [compost metagenome]
MTALGVLPEVAERCLNHTEDNKVKRIYQRHSYTTEMTAAWSLLGEHLDMLTKPKECESTLSELPRCGSPA